MISDNLSPPPLLQLLPQKFKPLERRAGLLAGGELSFFVKSHHLNSSNGMPLIPLKLPVLCPRRSLPAAAAANLLILLLFAPHPLASSPASDYLSYSFSSFDSDNSGNFSFSANAGHSQGALQVTPDTSNKLSYLLNRSGRILLSRPFRLWQDTSSSGNLKRAASFNTSFSINIYRLSNTTLPGEGLAFLIAPDAEDPPPGSYGGFLGLTNATIDGRSSNRFVAVEFDTVKQSYDPDDNHVGININSVVSNSTASLTPLGIQIAPVVTVNYTVWIDYDGVAGGVRVYMTQEGNLKPRTPVLAARLNLRDYVNQDSYFGFAAATGAADYELNCVLAWNLTVENLEQRIEKDGGTGWKIAVGIAAGVIVLATAAGLVGMSWYSKQRRKRKKMWTAVDPSQLAGTLKSLPGMPKEFEYKELRRATNGFDENMKLGQGGFGTVYRGVLPDEDGTEVAVKKFSREDNMNSQDDFLKELTVINRLRHKHLVRLLGWCHENGVLLLVYDYMPNGSLDQHLYKTTFSRPILPWNRRLQVAADVASALHYLHHEYDECVIHRDLKSSNVMLDSAFHARLGDFGLARVIDTDKTSYAELTAAGVPGTLGYIAPECFHTARATRESDVFAFGALLLELVCGRRPRCTDHLGFYFLADRVWMMHREGRLIDAVDERLVGDFDNDEARRLLLLGLACSHPWPGERPKAAVIMHTISGSLPAPIVPPFKPAFMWPAAEPSGEDSGGGGVGGLNSMSSLLTSSSLYASSNAPWTPHLVSRGDDDDV